MSYERTDASLRVVAVSVAILVLWVALALVVAAWLYRSHYDVPRPASAWARQTSFTNGPKTEMPMACEWTELSRTTSQHLGAYAWVDRNAGIAQIPIDRAMNWVVVHGVGAARVPMADSSIRKDTPQDDERRTRK